MNRSTCTPIESAGRVAIVTRRYWPCISDTTLRLQCFAQSLVRRGYEVQIITPRWHNTWPRRVCVEEIPVHRLENPPINQLRQSLYRRGLSDWLDECAFEIDYLFCDEPGLDTLTIQKHRLIKSRRTPVVVRFDHLELSSSVAVESCQPSQAVIDSCSSADRIVCPYQSSQQQLLRLGINAKSIAVLSDWGLRAVDRSSLACRNARQALADINSDLALRSHERLIVVSSELTNQWNLDFFVRAMIPLLDRYPQLRMWIHGDGPEREKLYELLQFFGHHRNVIMPGTISSIDSLLQAADLCIFPAQGIGMSWFIPTCLLSGIPTVVASSHELNWHLGMMAANIEFDPKSAGSLHDRIERWIKTPEELAASSRAIGQLIRRQQTGSIQSIGLQELLASTTSPRQTSHSSFPPS